MTENELFEMMKSVKPCRQPRDGDVWRVKSGQLIVLNSGKMTPDLASWAAGQGVKFGDWVSPQAYDDKGTYVGIWGSTSDPRLNLVELVTRCKWEYRVFWGSFGALGALLGEDDGWVDPPEEDEDEGDDPL